MNLMEFNFKAIGGFVLVAVVSYLCRPMNDIILGFFVDEKVECPVSGNVDGHDYVDLGLPGGFFRLLLELYSKKWFRCLLF